MPALKRSRAIRGCFGRGSHLGKARFPVCRSTAQKSGHYPNLDYIGVSDTYPAHVAELILDERFDLKSPLDGANFG
jgi:hypothetical protein